tara:strand:+ start:1205 stop:1621 length:417 start_codon:yes stop_codon:yes gene_type:complete
MFGPNEIDARRGQVQAWQRSYGMEPRGDSKLTELYAAGYVNETADKVARELCATDFVFQNTLYGEVIEDYLRCLAARVRETYGISWTSTWEVVRFYGPIALRLQMLQACGLRIPELSSVFDGAPTAAPPDDGCCEMTS